MVTQVTSDVIADGAITADKLDANAINDSITGTNLTLGNLSLGSTVAPTATTVTNHIAMYGTSYGFSITSSTLNYVSANNHVWYGTSGAETMRISGTGLVTTPALPAFHARSTNSPTAGQEYVFNSVTFNRGNHFNTTTGRFTVPVTGVYYFYLYGLHNYATAGDYRVAILKNLDSSYPLGSTIVTRPANYWVTFHAQGTMLLTANDFVSPYFVLGPAAIYNDPGYNGFGGYLIG